VTFLNTASARKILTTEAEQRQLGSLPGHDLTADRWVAVSGDGQMVGFGFVWRMPPTPYAEFFIAVHPTREADKLRARLLERVIHRAGELGATALLANAHLDDGPYRTFLERRGFEQVDGYRALSLLMDDPPTVPVWPDGFYVRTYEQVRKPEHFIEACNRSYGNLWGHKIATPELAEEILSSSPHDGIFLLYDEKGDVMGIGGASTLDNETEDAGEARATSRLDAPGVAPPHRSTLLYRNLALAGLGWLYERGHRHVTMQSWGDAAETIAAYEALSFTTTYEEVGYYLPIR